MKKLLCGIAVSIFALFCSCAVSRAADEKITITTYYPSPVGVYKQVRLAPQSTALPTPCLEGTMYYNHTAQSINVCNQTGAWQAVAGAAGYWAPSGNDISNTNTGNVGIGTNAPTAKLSVSGKVAINATVPSGVADLFVRNSWGYSQLQIDSRDKNWTSELIFSQGGRGSWDIMSQNEGDNYGLFFVPLYGFGGITFTQGNDIIGLRSLSASGTGYFGSSVGIGGSNPSYMLYVNGQIGTSGGWSSSDVRWKENISALPNPLEKIARLRGVTFDWRREEFKDKNFPQGRQVGVIAQELEKEYPELVITDGNGYKSVAYDKITAVLLEAVKAQQKEIEELKAILAAPKVNAK